MKLRAGQLRDGENGGLYLVIEPTVSDGFSCWRCLLLEADADYPEKVGALEDIPEQWMRNYTTVVG